MIYSLLEDEAMPPTRPAGAKPSSPPPDVDGIMVDTPPQKPGLPFTLEPREDMGLTPDTLEALKALTMIAKEAGHETFTFIDAQGKTFVIGTSYALHLCIYYTKNPPF